MKLPLLLIVNLVPLLAAPVYAQTEAPPPPNLAITASSEQVAANNLAMHAIDGKANTRWCTTGYGANAWIQYDLGREAKIASVQIDWEKNAAYKFVIETSTDGKTWETILDQKSNATPSSRVDAPARKFARFVKVTIVTSTADLWPSICELRVIGASGKALKSTLEP